MSQFSFRRLQNDLAEMIRSLPVETRLPSEPILAKKLGVSRATLREAMRSFEGKGMIRRRQGLGTFVAAKVPVLETGLEVLESLETIAQRMYLQVNMGKLTVEQIETDQELAQALNLPTGIPLTQVVRVMFTANRPIAYLIDTLPAHILSASELSPGFTGSVLDLLLKRGKPKPVQSHTEINAVGATPEVAHALQVQRDDVLLQFVALLYGDNGQIIDYSFSYFLPGYFRFHVIRKVGYSEN